MYYLTSVGAIFIFRSNEMSERFLFFVAMLTCACTCVNIPWCMSSKYAVLDLCMYADVNMNRRTYIILFDLIPIMLSFRGYPCRVCQHVHAFLRGFCNMHFCYYDKQTSVLARMYECTYLIVYMALFCMCAHAYTYTHSHTHPYTRTHTYTLTLILMMCICMECMSIIM
jgi:hypothetical protein